MTARDDTPLGDLSVIIPVRDGAATIAAAVESTAAHADGLAEIIVVDDGSVDASAAVARAASPLARVIAGRGLGPAAARNDGVRAARGELVGFCDADDLWLAGSPDPRRAALTDDPTCVALGRAQVERDGVPVGVPATVTLFGAVLARRELLLAHPLAEELMRGEDVEWFLRVQDAGVPLHRSSAVVMAYRRRPGSLSHDSSAGLLAGLRNAIERRGAGAA